MMAVFPVAVSRQKADKEADKGHKDKHNDGYGYCFSHHSPPSVLRVALSY